jgi:hypothetical protein
LIGREVTRDDKRAAGDRTVYDRAAEHATIHLEVGPPSDMDGREVAQSCGSIARKPDFHHRRPGRVVNAVRGADDIG